MYTHDIRPAGEHGRKDLPHAIPAEKLQAMLEADPAFCSWDAANSTVNDLTTGWPYLFSHPLMGADPQSPHGKHPELSTLS